MCGLWEKIDPNDPSGVVYVGVHVVHWNKTAQPTVGFIQYEMKEIE